MNLQKINNNYLIKNPFASQKLITIKQLSFIVENGIIDIFTFKWLVI